MSDDTSRFLGALFGDVRADLRFLIWTLPDKRSRWYVPGSIDQATAHVETLDTKDVYVGVGLSDRDRGERQRVQAKHVSGIVALWADVDFADDAHKKSNLPPTADDAMTVVDAMGPKPSIVVHSGHGLQAWWLLDEAWVFDDAEERARAAAMANRWNLTMRVRAGERGWVVDATQDLARVMRVPGTTNHKGDPVPVKVRALDRRRRYSVEDLETYCADDGALSMLAGRRTYAPGDLTLSRDASPPFSKFEALLQADTKFRQSWERTRRDMADDSASSYDLSLATLAASCDWSDQEIVDLLIASRSKHGDDLKLRQDYYQRTLARARDSHARATSGEEIESAVARVEHAQVVGDVSGVNKAKRDLTDHVSSLLGVEVTRLVRFLQDPPRYKLETPASAITLGTADVILNQTKMRACIAGATGIVIPREKGNKWDSVAQAIFAACEDEDTGIESTDEGIAYSWLIEYLQDRPVVDDRSVAATTQTPFQEPDGMLHVFGSTFRRWLWMSRGDRVTAARMGEVLRAFGCEHQVVNVEVDGKRTSRSTWRVPGLEEMRHQGKAGENGETA